MSVSTPGCFWPGNVGVPLDTNRLKEALINSVAPFPPVPQPETITLLPRPPSIMQKSFSDLEYAAKKKLTRRDRFLAEIDSVTPWSKLHKLVEPFYPKVEGAGRPPIGLARMLRMYVAQQCFGLSDEGIEDAIYDSQAIRAFVGIDLARESAPDATTLLKFRHLLEAKELTRQIFDAINGHLAEKGLMMREGTIVDATLIAAPPSTKNKDGKRDPEMHQSKKGNDWHFGMKAHIGVDAASGLVHTVVGTAGNVSDVTQAHALLHGDETAALGDAGYQGVEKRPENVGKAVTWHVAMKRSKRKALPNNKLGRMTEKLEHLKASVRAKVEHPFHVIKNLFRHRKARYRGLAKNTAQLFTLFGFANLVLAGRRFKVTETRVAT
jgi:IS5 family transposase